LASAAGFLFFQEGPLKRVQCYIDGFNLYHALADTRINHLKWLNLRSLAEAFIQPSKEALHEVFYFTAYAKWLPHAMVRHRAYIKALEAYNVTPILGHFKEKKMSCNKCGARWTSREEKGTDTNFVIQLIQEAHQNRFDKAIIMTADSDMVPAIHMVLDTFPEKKILVCTPYHRYDIAREIRNTVETRKMKLNHLQNNLLPQKVYCPAGKVVATRPVEYDPPA
jgi:uncharacterized LabA/DUF88 family protein